MYQDMIYLKEPIIPFEYEMICHSDALNLIKLDYNAGMNQLELNDGGMPSLDVILNTEKVTMASIVELFRSLEQTTIQLPDYLLNPNALCLHPQCIFWNETVNTWYFCYIPCETLPSAYFPISLPNRRLLLKYILFHDHQRLFREIDSSLLNTFLNNTDLSPFQWLTSTQPVPQGIDNTHETGNDKGRFKQFFSRDSSKQKPKQKQVQKPKPKPKQNLKQKSVSKQKQQKTAANRAANKTTVFSNSLKETQAVIKRAYLVAMITQERIALYYDDNTIGRGENNHIAINDATVSTRHATITKRDSNYFVLDHHSKNGTFVDHKRIKALTPLKNGQSLRIGEKEFIFIC
ncbi:FHA domain-containing protein [Fusibacter paucivorans]|uniref:FHA domain-containing protein n=1 Tax=Fusibacter paucivorans TaxID=76009 RepID=A0ABS5PSU7_9FIRM|nr:FHA domain-containing protein [Fusibacter paucivorans]MBS7528239.1 FHA domain-containing protein [Fusibacter paucivorans]